MPITMTRRSRSEAVGDGVERTLFDHDISRGCEPHSQHTQGLRFIEVFCSVSLRFFASSRADAENHYEDGQEVKTLLI